MEFHLVYHGPLPTGSGKAEYKHEIRLALHHQLRHLFVGHPGWSRLALESSIVHDDGRSQIRQVKDRSYLPLVSDAFGLYAELDVTLLRSPGPGFAPRGGFDIDNQLKTLLDGLRCPVHAQEVPEGLKWPEGGEALLCLLEDDRLVRRVGVTYGNLLAGENPEDVFVLVRVDVRRSRGMALNMDLPE